jgi:hypothetical protein
MKTKETIQKRIGLFFILLMLVNFAIPLQAANANPNLESSAVHTELLDLLNYPIEFSFDSSDLILSSMKNDFIFSRVDGEEEFTVETWMMESFDQGSDLLAEDAEEKIELAEWMMNCLTWRKGTDAAPCNKQST